MSDQSDDGDDLNVFSDLVEKRVAEKEAARQSVAPPPAASEPAPTSPPPRASDSERKAVPAPKFRADRGKALSIPPGHKGTLPGFPALTRPAAASIPPAKSSSASQSPAPTRSSAPQPSIPPPAPSSTNPAMAAVAQRSGRPAYAPAAGSSPHEEPSTATSSQVTRPSIPPSAVNASAPPASAPAAPSVGGPPSNPDGLPLLSELHDVVVASEVQPQAPGFDAAEDPPSIIVSDATPVGDGSGSNTDALVPSSITSAPTEAASRRTAVIAAVVGIAVVVGVFVVAFLLRPSDGALIVTAAGPDNADVDQANVLVDGEQRCKMVPCRVGSLDDGVHVVRVSAPGYQPSEPRAVTVRGGAEAVCDLILKPEKRRGRAVAATDRSSSEGVDLDSLPAIEDDRGSAARARRGAKAKAKRAGQPEGEEGATGESEGTDEDEATATAEEVILEESEGEAAEGDPTEEVATVGTVNLISLPSSQVAVDGKPMGNTPTTVKLPPGPHSVKFTHPEHGSKSVRVSVKAGKTTAAAVRFP